MNTNLRIARLTDDLAASVAFYRDGLGLEVLLQFEDHDGFDAVMLGARDAAYHLALVHKRGHTAGRAPARGDNLLVFYLAEPDAWQRAVARLEAVQPVLGQEGKDVRRSRRLSRGAPAGPVAGLIQRHGWPREAEGQ